MSKLNESYDDLIKKLHENRTQLKYIEDTLIGLKEDDKSYLELSELKNDILEVIALLEDLLRHKEKELNSGVIGKIVQVFYNGNKRYGKITEHISSDKDNNDSGSYNVLIFGSSNNNDKEKVEFRKDDVRFVPQVKDLKPGARAQALYEEDGNWYTCIILEVKSDGYIIRYVDYGDDKEFVSFDKVRNITQNKYKVNNIPTEDSGNKCDDSNTNTITTPGGYTIPAKLLIKPTDNDKIRLEKKKKVSVIKKQQKNEILENQAKVKQMSWKNHINQLQNRSRIK
ncbi:30 kDa splicing factor [Cryptosporidium ryanae]|uniref:30 kDa splicing factor n=1 Tax=Cryptosporidium ryanae TaxID=515981 RepID=UPI00351A9221|nr:30 kDa splicing factor [Cryptosporidium ryanae]